MACLPNQTNVNLDTYFFLLANASTINAGNINTFSISTNTINAAVGNISSLNVQNVSTTYLEASTIYSTEGTIDFLSTYTIELDGNYLTTDRVGGGGELLLNGFPIATTNNLSSIGDWSLYEAISTVKMNGNNLSNANGLYASNAVLTNSITAPMGSIRIFNSSNITNSNDIMTATLETTGGVTIGGTLLVNNITNSNAINTISLGARTGTFSTLSVSSLNVSSIVTPVSPNLVVSTLTATGVTTQGLLSQVSTTLNGLTTILNLNATNTASFANGANFYGTRPNFTTGINTGGPNNFNYQSLDNIRVVTGSNIDMFAVDPSGFGGESMTLGADGGTYTAFYPTTNIVSRYGGGGQVNITAERPSLLVGVPSQNVNITAKGGVGYYTGVPVGGGINLSAEAGGINLFTTTGVLGNGAIRQTAYTFFNGIYTVPGFAARSAGCSAEYSGLTSPTIPLYGCSFYSALTSLSLTAGITPASVSYPGVVYLRGDNGTKVVNGFYADTINNNLFYDLVIQSVTTPVLDTNNRNITLNSGSNINLNTNNGGQLYINGTPYSGGGGGGGWVSTATSDLNMNGYNIKASTILQVSTQYLYLFGSTITCSRGKYVINDGLDSIFNYTNNDFLVSSLTTNITSYANTNIKATNYINISSATVALNNVSSINGVAYTTGGGGWSGTATSDLNMSSFRIYGSNAGNSLGNFQAFKFVYEPPTATGQSAEFAIQAHPQDAGVIYNLRYGVDLDGAFGYLYCEWPGYIVVPMKISGQVVYLGEGEGVVANTNNYINNNTKGSFTVSSLTTTLGCQSDMLVNAPSTFTLTTKNFQVTEGSATNIQLINSAGTQYIDLFTGGGENEILLSQASGTTVKSSTFTNIIGEETNITGYSTINFYGKIVEHNNLDMNGFNLLAGNTVETQTLQNNPINPALNILATGNINLSTTTGNINFACGTPSGGGIKLYNYMVMVGAGNPIYMGGNTLDCQGGSVSGIDRLYFNATGNIGAFNYGGINYLDINAGNDTGYGTARLRIAGNKGRLDFDDNVGLAGNGSNQVGMYNQYGRIYLDPYQNVYLDGGGSHRGGEDQLHFHGTTYADGSYNLSVAGQGFNHAYSNAFIRTRCDYGNYGNLSMNGYFSVCQAGTSTELFVVPADTNANMWYSNGTGKFGIGTTTPAYKLDVNGSASAKSLTVGQISILPETTNGYSIQQIKGGNTQGYLFGDYQLLGDGIHLTYNAYGSNGAWVNPASYQNSRISLGYGNIQFCVGNTIGSSTAGPETLALLINSSGYLGVNTIYPEQPLHVAGNAKINGNLYMGGVSFINGYGGQINFDGNVSLYGTGTNNIGMYNGGSSYIQITSGGTIGIGNSAGSLGIDSANLNIQGNGSNTVSILSCAVAQVTASTKINLNAPDVTRKLGSSLVSQPVIQYGEDAGSGNSGNITIAIPVAYTSATSYVVFASMMDTTECKISVNRDSASQITVYWSQAGSGTHKIGWQTTGT